MTINELLKYAEEKTSDCTTDEILAEILPKLVEIGIIPTKELIDILITPIDNALNSIRDNIWSC